MSLFGSGVEYALHCLLWLAGHDGDGISARELAELQGLPGPYVAKLFPALEKAGVVRAVAGIRGGYRLARAADRITVLEVAEAIEGRTAIFECREIRARCALFGDRPPAWATQGVCAIHAVMQDAETALRDTLAATTLATLAEGVRRKAPKEFAVTVQRWTAHRREGRESARIRGLRRAAKKAGGD